MKKSASLFKVIRFSFLVSFGIELTQFLTNYFLGGWRGADIADLVVNTLGAVMGYLIVREVYKNAKSDSVIHEFRLN